MLWRRRILGARRYADEVGGGDSASRGEILTIAIEQQDNDATVTVTSNLGGTVYYHWFRDGKPVGVSQEPSATFHAAPNEQVEIDCIASRWPGLDHRRHKPRSYHGRRGLEWLRSGDSDVEHYLVQYQQDGGDWTTFRTVSHRVGQWGYQAQTPTLVDGSTYAFRVVPVDTSSLEGTPLSLDSLLIVRRPDVTGYAVSWSSGTGKVTFSAV